MRLNGYKRLWKLLPLTAVVFLLATLASCTGEEDIVRQTGEGDALVTLSLRLPGASLPASRALTETDENKVDEIDVLVFKPGGGIYEYSARGMNISGEGSVKTFTVKLRQGSCDLVILANSRDIIEAATLTGKNKATVLAALAAAVPEGGKWVATASATGFKPFPMWGDIGTKTISENMEKQSIQLLRMMARVDVTVDEKVTNFTLTSVHVYNYNTHGTVAPGSELDNGAVTAPTVPTASTLTKGPAVYTVPTANGKAYEREIYIMEAENHTDAGHTTAKDLLKRTCLVIGGKYDTENGQPTYYRVDFSTGSGAAQEYLDVLRNHQYAINITKVSGPGYETADIAFRSAPVNIEAGVTKWNAAQGGSIYFDQQYYLSVTPQTAFEFIRHEASQEATIVTDVPSGLKIAKITEADGTTPNTGWLTTEITSRDLKYHYTLHINVTTNNSNTERTGYIYITAGRIEAVLTVTQNTVSAFAGSNIVWMDGKLTFSTGADDTSVDARAQGVYFRWGSLVAISPAGTSFSAATSILYKPDECPSIASYDLIPYADNTDNTATNTDRFNNQVQTEDDFADYNNGSGYDAAKGVGDICRYISDKGWVEGSWRLPTDAEYQALLEASGKSPIISSRYYGNPVGVFSWSTSPDNVDANGLTVLRNHIVLSGLLFPASGYRGLHPNTGEDGLARMVGEFGYYRSGSSNGRLNTWHMDFNAFGAQWGKYSVGSLNPISVRCVRE